MTAVEIDQALMMRYQRGDGRAFDQLYLRHKGSLFRYLFRQCGHRETADELFQDVWLKLIRARVSYQPTAKFTTYLYHMAHNRLIDYYRSRQRDALSSYQDPLALDDLRVPESQGPESRELSRQQVARLMELIEGLPAAQREVFLLQQETTMTLDEIAIATGTSRETVKSRLRYAIGKLRAGMAEGGVTE